MVGMDAEALLAIRADFLFGQAFLGPFRAAHRLAVEILDLLDPCLAVHVEGREAKQARADHRQPDQVAALTRDLGREFGERHLRDRVG